MTQQPPPPSPKSTEGAPQQPPPRFSQSPQTPEGEPQHTEALWYEQTQARPRPAALTQPSAEPAQSATPRRLAELAAVAVLAAVLASTGTYAVTRVHEVASPPAQTRASATTSAAPVVQANASAPNWSVTAAAVSPSVVAISVQSVQGSGQGSGVIFDTQGHILTNNHVVAAGGAGSSISVTLNDQRTYDATIVGTDPSTDLAVIKLTNAPKDLRAIALGDASILKVGEPVMAVGNPLGLAGTVTTGIVSALNRPVTTSPQQSGDPFGQQSAGEPVVTNAVQTSAAINPGNSGGALVNAGGQLVGINSAIASLGSPGGSSSQGGNIGIGFAIPVNEARSIASQLTTSGKATHPYLGVGSKDGVVADGSAKRAAAVVTNVVSGTPADKAGLQAGDAIIAVDGNSIDGSLSLVAQVRERSVGDKVTVKLVRDGQNKDINVTLVNKPATNR
ncbi:MAG: trypsin-like peptidase domain-containing protein [Actinobacteria bacterium]|nr:trypsin-like peptidase domain-containing protein [Actinomycetota bacterium]